MTRAPFAGAAIAATFAVFAAGAQAAPISYDEAIDGDIDGTPTFNLDFGANTIAGTSAAAGLGLPGGNDFDFFNALLPANALLENITVQMDQNPAGTGFPGFFDWIVDGVPGFINTDLGGFFDIDFSIPASELMNVGPNGLALGDATDYLITINVSPLQDIPLPGALPLFLMGLGALGAAGAIRRRRQTV